MELVMQWFATNRNETPESLRQARHDLARNPGEMHAWYEVFMNMRPDDRYFVTVQHGHEQH